jgi:glycosyltransferase involved in cell wall biosynthesis
MNASRGLRIAVVAACPLPAARGTPIRIFRLSEALHDLGHEVHVVTYHLGDRHAPHSFQLHRIKDLGWYTRTQPGPSYLKLAVDLYLAARLSEVIVREDIQVIHAHHYEGLLAALLASRTHRIPIVFDVHSLLGSELSSYSLIVPRQVKDAVGRLLDRKLPGLASHVICVSQEICNRLEDMKAVFPNRVSVVPNGVELDYLASGKVYERSEDVGRLIFTGNLARYQGIDLMLTSFASICRQRDNIILDIVTSDTFQPYEKLARQLGIRDRVRIYPDNYSTLPHALANADVALNPRVDCAGVPQKLLNYMAARCPIVSFAGSARHLEHGCSGLIVDNGDTQAFSQAILTLIDNRNYARQLGSNAYAFVKANLSWEVSAREIERIFQSVRLTT